MVIVAHAKRLSQPQIRDFICLFGPPPPFDGLRWRSPLARR